MSLLNSIQALITRHKRRCPICQQWAFRTSWGEKRFRQEGSYLYKCGACGLYRIDIYTDPCVPWTRAEVFDTKDSRYSFVMVFEPTQTVTLHHGHIGKLIEVFRAMPIDITSFYRLSGPEQSSHIEKLLLLQ